MSYYCYNCDSYFENTVSIREYHNEVDDRPFEEYQGCPYCKSDDIVEAVQCSLCGQYVVCGYVKLNDGTIACSDCYEIPF